MTKGTPGKKLLPETKQRAIDMLLAGENVNHIVARLGISKSMVGNLMRELFADGRLEASSKKYPASPAITALLAEIRERMSNDD